MKHADAIAQLARETKRARRTLALERAARAGFWLAAALAAWAAFALLGAHEALPFLAQPLAALAAWGAFIALALRARRAWRAPTQADARARLAEDSKIEAAAFEALGDQPSRYDPFSLALWARAQDDAVARVEHARARAPRIRLGDIDRFYLRFALIGVVVAGVLIASAAGPDRLARAFLPDPGPLLGDKPMAVEAWVTPASYTHAAPLSLSDRLGQSVETPPSVRATVRVSGPAGAPRLVFTGAGGRREARFTRAADGAWEAHMDIPGAGALKIVRFHTRASWRLQPAPDARPSATFAAPLVAEKNEHVAIAWRATDDYGVRRVFLRVRPINPPAGLLRADPVDTELEAPAGDPRSAEAQVAVDLAAHPYAGMEVEARMVAEDALGQQGVSTPMRFVLPEKIFLQPLARAAIEIRRHILTDRRTYRPAPRARVETMRDPQGQRADAHVEVRDFDRRPALQRAPEGVRRAARLLDSLTMAPQDGYFRDLAVYLGLRYARSELDLAQSIDETADAADTLWRTALRAEYGGSADARRALEEIQRQLAEALAQGAPPEKIRQLMEAMREATQNYMQALVQEAMRTGQPENVEDTEEQTELSQRDIENMMREVQRLAEQGRHAEAQQMLDQLTNILANMDVRLTQSQSGEGGEGEGEDGQMQQSMDQLSQAMGEQRALNNDTQQQQQQQQQGPEQQQQQQSSGGSGGDQQGGMGGDELAERQSDIREALADAQRMADEGGAAPSESLNEAGRAMRQAEDALRRGDMEGARAAQNAALDQMREGAETLAAEMRERGRQGGQGERGGEQGGARDPLGRAIGGNEGEGDAVPQSSDPERARQIFDEIRRRAQDAERPEAERDYLRRLLDRFGDS
ncbi:MAG TPA: DUF4175 family protein [Terricaulis sp.]|nr:DUF4175 family protein [Terricaulis sp.]